MTPSWHRVPRLVIDSRAGATPDFKVGGTITMRLKVGSDATNYPLVSLGIEFQLVGLRMNLNGALSGEGDPQGCWRK